MTGRMVTGWTSLGDRNLWSLYLEMRSSECPPAIHNSFVFTPLLKHVSVLAVTLTT